MVQDTEDRLKAVFQKYLEKVIYFCSAEKISPNIAVHEMRKSFKRIRALLKFFSLTSHPYFYEFKTQLVSIGKSISELRESAVNIQVFDRLSTKNTLIAERKLRFAKERLFEKNKLLIKENFIDRNACLSILSLFKDYESELNNFEKDCPTVEQILERISKSFRKSYSCFQNINLNYEGEELHNLRKKMKVLWYQMDFIIYLNPKYLRVKSEQLHKITEHLGEDHDLFVFSNEIRSEMYGFNPADLEILQNQIQHLRDINRVKLVSRLKPFFNEPPDIFDRKMRAILAV